MPAAGTDSRRSGNQGDREVVPSARADGSPAPRAWRSAWGLAVAVLYGYALVSLLGMLWWPLGRDQGIWLGFRVGLSWLASSIIFTWAAQRGVVGARGFSGSD